MSVPTPAPISSATSSGAQRGEPLDHAEQVVVDEEVLPEARVGPQAELGQPRERDLARRRSRQGEDAGGVGLDLRGQLAGAATPRMAATARSVSST